MKAPPIKVHGRRVEMLPLGSLVPFDRNAREHPESQLAVLEAVIRDSGFTSPLVIDHENVIVAGHGRLIAAERAGMTEVPCVRVEGLTPEQVRALRISDNQIGLLSSWDSERLRGELADLKFAGFDLPNLSGFSVTDLNTILGPRDGVDPEAVPPPPASPVSRPGDLWLLGDHRILCGDATSKADVEALLQGDVPNLMVTDPPYGVEYDADWRNRQIRPNGRKYGSRAIGKVSNDDNADWRRAWALFPGDVAYVWAAGLTSDITIQSLEACGLMRRSHLIWNKNVAVISRGHYHFKHEVLWYAVRQGKTGRWQGDNTQASVWDIPKPHASETGHSTQKPIECMARPIRNNSREGDLVYDPFLGSSTLLIACEMTGRRGLGLEINPAYCDVGVRRWETFVGRDARHASGKTFSEVIQERKAKRRITPRPGVRSSPSAR